MARRIEIRTRAAGGETEVLVLVNHPMETGQRIDPVTREKIPPHFIQKMIFTLNGTQVANADLGKTISRDPLVGIRIRGARAGDIVQVTWTDNMGENGSAEATVA